MKIGVQWRVWAIFAASFVIIATACKKEKDSSVIEIAEVSTSGNEKLIKMDFLPANETVTLLTLKNTSTGSGSVHVKLAKDDAAVTTAAATLLPPNSYTLANLEFDVPANGSIDVPITINKSVLTVDTIWGIGLKIESATGATIANPTNSLVVKFDLRNRWDGRYRVTGTFTDIAAPTLTFTEQEVSLITTSPTSVVMIPKDLGIAGYLILSGTSLSYYGSFGPVFILDPATNKIVSVINSYGQPASNTRSAEIDPSGTNNWDPATKAITVKFFMKQPNTVTTPPYIRVYFNNTMIYLGERF
jgi:hypothetical protein